MNRAIFKGKKEGLTLKELGFPLINQYLAERHLDQTQGMLLDQDF